MLTVNAGGAYQSSSNRDYARGRGFDLVTNGLQDCSKYTIKDCGSHLEITEAKTGEVFLVRLSGCHPTRVIRWSANKHGPTGNSMSTTPKSPKGDEKAESPASRGKSHKEQRRGDNLPVWLPHEKQQNTIPWHFQDQVLGIPLLHEDKSTYGSDSQYQKD